jgi:hypothetical protein
MSTAPDEGKYAKDFALWLISVLEDCAIQNARMKAFILSLPLAQQPGFSLDRLLAETAQAADTVQGLRQRYGAVRGMLLEFPPREVEARAAIQSGDGTNQPK